MKRKYTFTNDGKEYTAAEVAKIAGTTVATVYTRHRKGQDVFAPHTGRGRRRGFSRASAVARTVDMFVDALATAISEHGVL